MFAFVVISVHSKHKKEAEKNSKIVKTQKYVIGILRTELKMNEIKNITKYENKLFLRVRIREDKNPDGTRNGRLECACKRGAIMSVHERVYVRLYVHG